MCYYSLAFVVGLLVCRESVWLLDDLALGWSCVVVCGGASLMCGCRVSIQVDVLKLECNDVGSTSAASSAAIIEAP